MLLKFDVVDFYLSGEHDLIIREAVKCVEEGPKKAFLEAALPVVLGHQFVRNSFDTEMSKDTCFRVTRGSGIGMKHAGALADAVFAKAVEEPVLSRAAELGVVLFLRFRDDVFVAIDNPRSAKRFIETFTSAAAVFCEVKLESFSLVSTHFLDMVVFKSDGGTLQHCPFVKESARHIPLASDSYHPWSVHRSWPVSEVRRMFRRSSDARTGLAWSQSKVNNFKHYLLEESVLAACRLEQARTSSTVAERFLQTVRPDTVPCGRLVRLILPYRAELRSLSRSVSELLGDWNRLLTNAVGMTVRVQICWSKAGVALAQLCGRRMW